MSEAPTKPAGRAERASPAFAADRPVFDERAEYRPRARVERFIVPLLARAIPAAIHRHARRGGAALDVGCGRQPFRGLIGSLGMSYTGMDAQQTPEGTVDVVAPIDRPLPPDLTSRGPFSLVLCTEVLEHVADWDAAFANMSALMARGGRVILTCPQVYPLHEEPFDFWRPTPHAIRRFAESRGFRVLELEKLGDGWDVLGTVLAAFSPRPARGGAGVVGVVPAFLVRTMRTVAFRVIGTRALQRVVRDSGPLYLSNLAVLEKP